MSENTEKLIINNIELHWSSNDEISLTLLWEMAGKPKGKEPKEYLRTTEKAEFLCKILQESKGGLCPPLPKRPDSGSHDHAARKWASTITEIAKNVEPAIIKIKTGKFGGTFAYWKIALDYAGYLSPSLKSQFYEWIRERIEEEADPELAYKRGKDRAILGWKRQGKSEDWIQDRINSIENYKTHTSILQVHGVGWKGKQNGYAECADAINHEILGGRSKKIKEALGLTKSGRLRDHLNRKQLTALSFAEALADDEIETCALKGNNACKGACKDSASRVAIAARNSTKILNS
jgi:hypothetical protein